ncbi:MAG: FkbM family methyltransferase [Methanomicrobiales archaeon]
MNAVLLPFRRHGCWWLPRWQDDVLALVRRGCFEEAEMRFVQSYLWPGMIFWDIGACFGLYTIPAARIVGDTGEVVAVEPDPRNLRALRWHCRANRVRPAVIPAAAAERAGRAPFFSCRLGAYSSLTGEDVPAPVTPTTVATVTLDSLLRDHEPPDLLKIDVEGGEGGVLAGAGAVIASRPVILVEVSDIRARPFGHTGRDLCRWLERRGYAMHSLTAEGRPVRHQVRGRYHCTNLLALPDGQEL